MDYLKEEAALQDSISRLYEDKRYAKPYSFAYHKWWAEKMISFLNLKNPILDNGCGPGFMAQFLKGYQVTGLDISPKMAELAKTRYSQVLVGDAQNLPLKDSSFGTVINKGVLHHLENPQKGVKEIRRILTEGGEAVFAEPVSSFINSFPRKILRGGKHFSHSHGNFKEEELRRIIESGLKIKKIYHFGYLGYLLLGFPDVIDAYKFVPFKKIFTPFLIKIDELISMIPVLNKSLCWGIMIVAYKEYGKQ